MTDHFDANLSLSKEAGPTIFGLIYLSSRELTSGSPQDMQNMQNWGFNNVRLGIMVRGVVASAAAPHLQLNHSSSLLMCSVCSGLAWSRAKGSTTSPI